MRILLDWIHRLTAPRQSRQHVVRLIESIRNDSASLSYHSRTGDPMLFLACGWSVASINNRLVSIPDISTTPNEEREICDAISDRVAAIIAEDRKKGGSK